MAHLSTSERMHLMALATNKWRRRALSRALYSPVLKWRFGSSIADQLLIVPQELRSGDPSFWSEMEIGQFGLAGCLAIIDDDCPFDVSAPSIGWERSLHGFAWLRHLAATDEKEARESARRLVIEWIGRNKSGGSGVAWEPDVTGRRLISWITQVGILLEDADPKTYDAISASMGRQIVWLSATWRNALPGVARLTALIAVTLCDLTVAGHQHRLDDAVRALSFELDKQILADGGHISRNPAVLVDLMLDLLPLHQCFKARELPPPPALSKAIARALSMLRFVRMGDGLLARFNGAGASSAAGLATVLAYDDLDSLEIEHVEAAQSGYARLVLGDSVMLVDVGPPPALEYASQAHAGALSFELSSGRTLIFINGGEPSFADSEWREASRATAAHNTLRLGETSSSKMVSHRLFTELTGGTPIRYPKVCSGTVIKGDNSIVLKASHDGYVHRFGLRHQRELTLSNNGLRLDGLDRIDAGGVGVRLRTDLPFSIHFHVHPDVELLEDEGQNSVLLKFLDGSVWQFVAQGFEVSIEDSIYFADTAGASRTSQIVVRGATFGESEVKWSVFSL